MNKYFYTLFSILILSCNQNSTQVEKNYIKTLEEKNKILEKELQKIRSNNESINNQETKNKSKNYFTIGSTEDEVIEVMGQPTSYFVTATKARKFNYGISTVYFFENKVISYDNLGNNLKVRIK